MNHIEAINLALKSLFENNCDIKLFGEDVAGEYGGAFKATKGLSELFPSRVINMPISEAAFTGLGIGRALSGYPTIIEYMFGDFSLLAADQIINQAAKFDSQFGFSKPVPLLIRMPMGAGRGYGSTHSQSLEKVFVGHPGLIVKTASNFDCDLVALYSEFLITKKPTIIIENKILYSSHQYNISHFGEGSYFNDFCFIAYGRMFSIAHEISRSLKTMGYNICLVNVIDLYPLNIDELNIKKIVNSKNVVILAEETSGYGFVEQLSTFLCKLGVKDNSVLSMNSSDSSIAASRLLEDKIIITINSVIKAVKDKYEL